MKARAAGNWFHYHKMVYTMERCIKNNFLRQNCWKQWIRILILLEYKQHIFYQHMGINFLYYAISHGRVRLFNDFTKKKQGKQKCVFYDHLLHHTVTLQSCILCLWYSWSCATDFVIFPILCLTFPVETVRITQASNKPMVHTLCTEAVSVGIYQLRPVK